MRRRLVPAVLAAAVTVAAGGCGGDGEPRAALEPVRLEVTAPADAAVVREEVVEVRGTVVPADASVRVLGKAAHVAAGEFSAEVPLTPGANVIDVMASAGGRAPAMTAIRVVREVPVDVPDLEGATVEEAQERARDAGLELDVEDVGGGLIDDILPGEPRVCDQEPAPGTEVQRGSTVRVTVSKTC